MYLAWAILPDSTLHSCGIYYYPDRYWALVGPIWSLLFVVFAYAIFTSVNMLNTPSLNAFSIVTDRYANYKPDEEGYVVLDDRDVIGVELIDLPVVEVNRVIYRRLPVHYQVRYASKRSNA